MNRMIGSLQMNLRNWSNPNFTAANSKMNECCLRSDTELSRDANMTGCMTSLVEPSPIVRSCTWPKKAAMPTFDASVPTIVFNPL